MEDFLDDSYESPGLWMPWNETTEALPLAEMDTNSLMLHSGVTLDDDVDFYFQDYLEQARSVDQDDTIDDGDQFVFIMERISDGIPFDRQGDLIILVTDPITFSRTRFLACSKLLCLASPGFSRLIMALPEGFYLDLVENFQAMEMILRILHFQCADIPLSLAPDFLATLATLCDKYDCSTAFKSWAAHWCRTFGKHSSEQDLAYGLLAIHRFRLSTFSTVAGLLVQKLPADFVPRHGGEDWMRRMPQATIDSLKSVLTSIFGHLQQEFISKERGLRRDITTYCMPNFCPQCARVQPHGVKNCSECSDTPLITSHCTVISRLTAFFGILSSHGIRPALKPFETLSLSTIMTNLTKAARDIQSKHNCAGKIKCPLKTHLDALDMSCRLYLEEDLNRLVPQVKM